MLLLHNMDLLDLCAYDKHLQRIKMEEYEGKFNMQLNEDALYYFMNEIKILINKCLILQILPQCLSTYCGNV